MGDESADSHRRNTHNLDELQYVVALLENSLHWRTLRYNNL